jgi:hypothetical protein
MCGRALHQLRHHRQGPRRLDASPSAVATRRIA